LAATPSVHIGRESRTWTFPSASSLTDLNDRMSNSDRWWRRRPNRTERVSAPEASVLLADEEQTGAAHMARILSHRSRLFAMSSVHHETWSLATTDLRKMRKPRLNVEEGCRVREGYTRRSRCRARRRISLGQLRCDRQVIRRRSKSASRS